jgi:hypothetical protein
VVAIAILLAWTVFVQVADHLRDRGGKLRRLDPGTPYMIEFGRGSALDGFDTIKVGQDGSVTLHRVRREMGELFVETTTLQLPPAALAAVLDAVDETGLLSLYKTYHEPGVADGEQWILWVRQGQDHKSVYCDNHFPKRIVQFAEALDTILAEHGLDRAEWRRVADDDAWKYDRELRDSFRH